MHACAGRQAWGWHFCFRPIPLLARPPSLISQPHPYSHAPSHPPRRPDGEAGVKGMPPGTYQMDRFCIEPTSFNVKVGGPSVVCMPKRGQTAAHPSACWLGWEVAGLGQVDWGHVCVQGLHPPPTRVPHSQALGSPLPPPIPCHRCCTGARRQPVPQVHPGHPPDVHAV